jgi:hypothetical protein
MSSQMQIDTDDTRAALGAAATDRTTAITGTAITLPQGSYVTPTNALAASLVVERLAQLTVLVTTGTVATQVSTAAYESTEHGNAGSLST